MSTEYKGITDQLKSVLNARRTTKLSENLSTSLVAVKKGQYVPGDTADKPVLYLRLKRSAVVKEMAGHQSRLERLKFILSGACVSDTQEAAIDDATNLFNNTTHVLENHANEAGYWTAGSLSWESEHEGDEGADYGEIEIEPGPNRTIAHFTLLWACSVKIGVDAL